MNPHTPVIDMRDHSLKIHHKECKEVLEDAIKEFMKIQQNLSYSQVKEWRSDMDRVRRRIWDIECEASIRGLSLSDE